MNLPSQPHQDPRFDTAHARHDHPIDTRRVRVDGSHGLRAQPLDPTPLRHAKRPEGASPAANGVPIDPVWKAFPLADPWLSLE